jgi:AraC-like DNA-binding protein
MTRFAPMSLLLFFCTSLWANASIKVVTDSAARDFPWKTRYVSEGPLPLREKAALHGKTGILFSSDDTVYSRYETFAPFLDEFFLRYYFKVSQWPAARDRADTVYLLNILLMNFSEPIQAQKPRYFLRWHLFSVHDTVFLQTYFRPSADDRSIRTCVSPAAMNTRSCFEAGFRFFPDDTLKIFVRLDGAPVCTLSGYFGYSKDFIGLGTGRWARRLAKGIEVFVDEITISNKELPPMPPAPVRLRADPKTDAVILSCDAFKTAYLHEKHRATRWVVWEHAYPAYPVFDAVETDPLFLYRRQVPFPLDSGLYHWKCAFANQHDEWSDYTSGPSIVVPGQRPLTIKIKSAHFTLPGKETPLMEIIAGTWYDFHVLIETGLAWDSIGYALVRLNRPAYSFGHAANFGGVFKRASSYIYNFSMNEPSKNIYRIFEKSKENSTIGRCLEKGMTGIYLDADSSKVLMDSVAKHLRFPARVLPEAESGEWMLSATMRDSRERLSNLFRSPLTVKKRGPSFGKAVFAVLAAVLVFAAGLVLLLKRRSRLLSTAPADRKLFRQVEDYIRLHLNEELNLKRIKDELGISLRRLHGLLEAHGRANLPSLVNHLRIQKAGELLKEPNRTISEIGFLVGFKDPVYFTKVFKEITGHTPSEFREKTLK